MPLTTISDVARTKVRTRAEEQMCDTVTIYRGDIGLMNTSTGMMSGITNVSTIYTGIARIHVMSGTGTIAIGAGTVAQQQTVVSIPISAPKTHRDDVVVVNTAIDANQEGRAYRVLEVTGAGSFYPVRQHTCSAWAASRFWEGEQ